MKNKLQIVFKKIIVFLGIAILTSLLFLFGAWILIKNDIVQFELTNRLLREYNYHKAISYDKKILVLGDSQLEKWPMWHCLDKDLEDFFDDKEIGYLNAAHYGFGPIEYLNQLEEIIPFYKPDYILLFYNVVNDLSDVLYRDSTDAKKSTRQIIFVDSINNDFKYRLLESIDDGKSNLQLDEFDWENYRKIGIDTQIIRFAKNRILQPNKIGSEYINPHILAIASWMPNYNFDNCTIDSSFSQYGWYNSLDVFSRISNIADSINARLAIVVIPATVQVDTSHYDFYRKTKLRVSKALLTSNAPQQILKSYALENGALFFDLLPGFKQDIVAEKLYFENDDHLSEYGQIKAFEAIETTFLSSILNVSVVMRSGSNNIQSRFKLSGIHYKMDQIRTDDVWLEDIKRKASINGIPIDSQLYIDAQFVLAQEEVEAQMKANEHE